MSRAGSAGGAHPAGGGPAGAGDGRPVPSGGTLTNAPGSPATTRLLGGGRRGRLDDGRRGTRCEQWPGDRVRIHARGERLADSEPAGGAGGLERRRRRRVRVLGCGLAGRLGGRRRRALRGAAAAAAWPGLRVQPPGRWLGAADHAQPDHQRVRPSRRRPTRPRVALSPDGTYLAAGASGYSSSQSLTGQGGVYVWSYNGSALTTAGSGLLTASDAANEDGLGWSVAMPSDGVIYAGAPTTRERRTRGGVRVLLGDQLRDRLRALGARLADRVERRGSSRFGFSVAAGGAVVAAGAPETASNQGAVYLFEPAFGCVTQLTHGCFRSASYTTPSATLTDPSGNGQLGTAVALTGDGGAVRQARLVGRCRRTRPPAPRTCSRRRVAAGPTPRFRPRR